ncbi:hypothetical protein PoB_005808500 [Plakobranchus ocellatus]|uniref:Uncharacterized protein n=1 Tax=Plakobranchus ocellatus TaxID=259542 RepID=A0AAV4CIE5_9GAST|nr:hypothetical protein PoB_005808500 [Plakobranchus ocellatus]
MLSYQDRLVDEDFCKYQVPHFTAELYSLTKYSRTHTHIHTQTRDGWSLKGGIVFGWALAVADRGGENGDDTDKENEENEEEEEEEEKEEEEKEEEEESAQSSLIIPGPPQ